MFSMNSFRTKISDYDDHHGDFIFDSASYMLAGSVYSFSADIMHLSHFVHLLILMLLLFL